MKQLKRTLCVLLSALMLISVFAAVPLTAGAAQSGDYKYSVRGDGTALIVGYTGSASVLEIPGTIDGHVVSSIGNSAFYGVDSLTSVTIPGSVATIGVCAFCHCEYLRKVEIPSSVTTIENYAFQFCYALESIEIPDSVTSIGEKAFEYCTTLENVTIPGSVTSMGTYVFSNCDNLGGVTIGEGITSISEGAFYNCTSLTYVKIPVSVKAIGGNAFSKCYNLLDVYYEGNSLQWYGIDFGYGNEYLTSATLHCEQPTPVTDPIVKDTVYLNAAATSADNQDFYAWIWTTAVDGAWTKMEADANGYYTAQIAAGQNVVFARLPGGETPAADWSNIWNQTGDLVYDGVNNLFTTTGYEYNQLRGKDDMVGTWSVYGDVTADFSLSRLYVDNSDARWSSVYLYGWGSVFNGEEVYQLTNISGTDIWYIDLPQPLEDGVETFLLKNTPGSSDWNQQSPNITVTKPYNCYILNPICLVPGEWATYEDGQDSTASTSAATDPTEETTKPTEAPTTEPEPSTAAPTTAAPATTAATDPEGLPKGLTVSNLSTTDSSLLTDYSFKVTDDETKSILITAERNDTSIGGYVIYIDGTEVKELNYDNSCTWNPTVGTYEIKTERYNLQRQVVATMTATLTVDEAFFDGNTTEPTADPEGLPKGLTVSNLSTTDSSLLTSYSFKVTDDETKSILITAERNDTSIGGYVIYIDGTEVKELSYGNSCTWNPTVGTHDIKTERYNLQMQVVATMTATLTVDEAFFDNTTETTAPSEPETTEPTELVTYNFYFAPLEADVDAGYTFKINFQDAAAETAASGWTTLDMTEVGGGVYTASADLATDMSVNKIQYQVWNGEAWVREYTIDGIAPLANYNKKVITATSESAYVITDYVVTTAPTTTAAPTTAPSTAPATDPVTYPEPSTAAPTTTAPVEETYTVYFKTNMGWINDLGCSLYMYDVDTQQTYDMVKDENAYPNVYVAQVPVSTANVIFYRALEAVEGDPTGVDVAYNLMPATLSPENNCYRLYDYPVGSEPEYSIEPYEAEEMPNFSLSRVYVDNSATKWESVYIYGWGESGLGNAAFPMTNIDGTDIWYFDFPAPILVGKGDFLFKNTETVWDQQTDDVTVEADCNLFNLNTETWTVYSEGGTVATNPTDVTEAPTQAPTTVPPTTEAPTRVPATDPVATDPVTNPATEPVTTEPVTTEPATFPADAPKFVVSDITAKNGSTITVDVSIENNPGITAFNVTLDYSTQALTLTGVEYKKLFSSKATGAKDLTSPFTISWFSSKSEDETENGVLATLTFEINENAEPGDYYINLTYAPENVFDSTFTNVAFAVDNGVITVIDYIPGDVNGDGKVNMKDVVLLQQYMNNWHVTVNMKAADVNGDASVNMKDIVLLQQYLNGWSVELKAGG